MIAYEAAQLVKPHMLVIVHLHQMNCEIASAAALRAFEDHGVSSFMPSAISLSASEACSSRIVASSTAARDKT